MKNGYIYLLKSKEFSKLYLGSTDNPSRRIKYHNDGYSKATRNFKPWDCLLVINVGNLQEARRIEYYIKENKEKLVIQNVIKSLNRYFEKYS